MGKKKTCVASVSSKNNDKFFTENFKLLISFLSFEL